MSNKADEQPGDAGHLSVLPAARWMALREEHQQQVHELTKNHRRRRRSAELHPVWDFMFSYYPVSPGKLSHWHPGAGTWLDMENTGEMAKVASEEKQHLLPHYKDHYVQRGTVWGLDLQRHWDDRGKSITYIHRLLSLTKQRPPQLGCFGLHEWAMVYRDTPRHPEPLRLGAEGTNQMVENSQLKCTHIDAFRFFTPQAAPRNQLRPTRETQTELEQPGCLHATMDVYKWATKLGPLLPGELWLRTFALACDVRVLDMEASPYDLQEWGFAPVKIEEPAGRAEYVRRQQELMRRGQALRGEILDILEEAFPHLRTPSS